jgi:hypothetical protein
MVQFFNNVNDGMYHKINEFFPLKCDGIETKDGARMVIRNALLAMDGHKRMVDKKLRHLYNS